MSLSEYSSADKDSTELPEQIIDSTELPEQTIDITELPEQTIVKLENMKNMKSTKLIKR